MEVCRFLQQGGWFRRKLPWRLDGNSDMATTLTWRDRIVDTMATQVHRRCAATDQKSLLGISSLVQSLGGGGDRKHTCCITETVVAIPRDENAAPLVVYVYERQSPPISGSLHAERTRKLVLWHHDGGFVFGEFVGKHLDIAGCVMHVGKYMHVAVHSQIIAGIYFFATSIWTSVVPPSHNSVLFFFSSFPVRSQDQPVIRLHCEFLRVSQTTTWSWRRWSTLYTCVADMWVYRSRIDIFARGTLLKVHMACWEPKYTFSKGHRPFYLLAIFEMLTRNYKCWQGFGLRNPPNYSMCFFNGIQYFPRAVHITLVRTKELIVCVCARVCETLFSIIERKPTKLRISVHNMCFGWRTLLKVHVAHCESPNLGIPYATSLTQYVYSLSSSTWLFQHSFVLLPLRIKSEKIEIRRVLCLQGNPHSN